MELFSQSGDASSFGKTGPESLSLSVSLTDSSQLEMMWESNEGLGMRESRASHISRGDVRRFQGPLSTSFLPEETPPRLVW